MKARDEDKPRVVDPRAEALDALSGRPAHRRVAGKPDQGDRFAVHHGDGAERFADEPGPASIMVAGQQGVPHLGRVAPRHAMNFHAAHRLIRCARTRPRDFVVCHGPSLSPPPRTSQPWGAHGPVCRGQPDFGLALGYGLRSNGVPLCRPIDPIPGTLWRYSAIRGGGDKQACNCSNTWVTKRLACG